MAKYKVRHGYVLFDANGNPILPGQIIEPTEEMLELQGWKLELVEEVKPPKHHGKAVKEPPHDRAIKEADKTS